jgi:DNA invertase Pin-like site-specific DNA recombinase
MKGYFSYVRVSTQRQGQQGTSLTEQTAAIDRYAQTWNLQIIKRFEERETAAKTGRPVFLDMVRALKRHKARGVIIHKIDRSARNLRDWAELGSLIDLGVEVHFANESLDLSSRGGRLSADIQAVVASDYIRNLREETIKGMHGRVKQGFYPLPAPIGYVDSGPAKAKELDPIRAPLIKRAFELYETGRYSLFTLSRKMYDLGLRNRNGGSLTKTALNICLRNPFYMGLVRLRSMPESFVGQHQPIVSNLLFENVQLVLSGKRVKKKTAHFFIFRQTISCSNCQNKLVAERQKGHVYYRCHTRSCPQRPFREDLVLDRFGDVLKKLELSESDAAEVEAEIKRLEEQEPKQAELRKRELVLRMEQIESRLDRLADGYMDGVFDKEVYTRKREAFVRQRLETTEKLGEVPIDPLQELSQVREFLEQLKSAYLSFKGANDQEKRDFVRIVCSNITAAGESLIFKLNSPFQETHDRTSGLSGGPFRDTFRTNSAFLSQFVNHFRKNSA